MFYCNNCAKKMNYPIGQFKSYGNCEICGKIRKCNDIPSKDLPMPTIYDKCLHKKTVALNEEGHAGVYCPNCGEKLEDAC